MSVGKPQNLTPSTTNTQKTQQTVQSQPTPEQKLIGESLRKIVGQKQKWEQGLPEGFESGNKIATQLNGLLKDGSHPSKNIKITDLLDHLDSNIKELVEQYGFPTHDRNESTYSSSFGNCLHFSSKSDDYTNSGGDSTEGMIARSKVRAAMTLAILLQTPERELTTLRAQLCKGTNQDRDNAIKRLESKVRENFRRVDDFSTLLPNLLKNYPRTVLKYRSPMGEDFFRRPSLNTALRYNASRDSRFHPTHFTSPKNHDRSSYRLHVHMFQSISSPQKHVIEQESGKIKNNWPENARVISTSVISQDIGTNWGRIGLSLRVDPKRVIVSDGVDLSTKLGRNFRVPFYDEATVGRGETEPFRMMSVEELLNGGTTGMWNEVIVQGGTPVMGDPKPEGTVQINGVVMYDQATTEERQFAQIIANANGLPLLELGDQSRTRNIIQFKKTSEKPKSIDKDD